VKVKKQEAFEKTKLTKSKIRFITVSALFAAVVSVCAPFSFPIGTVPISATTFFVYLSGLMLGWRGCFPMLCYFVIGALGFPVFSGFSGGVGHLVGPTGGFIVSYPISSLVIGLLRRENRIVRNFFALFIGAFACYIIGLGWYCIETSVGPGEAVIVVVLPFVVTEILKIIAAYFVYSIIRKNFRVGV